MEQSGRSLLLVLLLACFTIQITATRYSAEVNAEIIAIFREIFMPLRDHAKVARELVHASIWTSFGSISTDDKIKGFPMVNVISISDSAENEVSTGKIYFLLTDLDFTGKDWRKDNKVTLLFSTDQGGNCSKIDVDPMEPTCARAYISGKIIELNKDSVDFKFGMDAFISRHPSARNWIKRHIFYLCLLDIEHIYVMDCYGGPHEVSVNDYYSKKLKHDGFHYWINDVLRHSKFYTA